MDLGWAGPDGQRGRSNTDKEHMRPKHGLGLFSCPVHWAWSSSPCLPWLQKHPLAFPSLAFPGTPFPSQQPLHSSGLHSSDACAPKHPQSLPQGVSLTSSSSLRQPCIQSTDPIPFSFASHQAIHLLSDTLSSTTGPGLGEGSGDVCGIECRLVREEAWHSLGHP